MNESKLTNREYIEEIDNLKNRMLEAEKFAKKFPYFEKQIINHKITGDGHVKFTGKYKDTYLAWGINRCYHETSINISNYGNEHDKIGRYLSRVYVNTLTLYEMHSNFGLFDIYKSCKIFYTDHFNTTFYLEDEHLVDFLDNLNDWYLGAREKARDLQKKEKLKTLEKEITKLKELKK